MPSGLNSDTGDINGICVQAHATATFGGLKSGMTKAIHLCGLIRVCDISAPLQLYREMNKIP